MHATIIYLINFKVGWGFVAFFILKSKVKNISLQCHKQLHTLTGTSSYFNQWLICNEERFSGFLKDFFVAWTNEQWIPTVNIRYWVKICIPICKYAELFSNMHWEGLYFCPHCI